MGESYKRAWYRKSEPRVTQILFLILPLLCISCFMRLIIYPHLFYIGFPVVHSRNYFFCHNSNNLLHKVVLVALVRKDVWKDLTGMFTKVQLSYLSWWFLVPLPAIPWQGQSTGLVICGDFVCLFFKKWLKNKWGQNKKNPEAGFQGKVCGRMLGHGKCSDQLRKQWIQMRRQAPSFSLFFLYQHNTFIEEMKHNWGICMC